MVKRSLTSRPFTRALLGTFAIITAVVALFSWGLSSPMGASPDEDYHLTSIWCGLGERPGLCEAAEHADEKMVMRALPEAAFCYAFKNENSASCQTFNTQMHPTTRGNFDGSYPPGFYGTMSVFASTHMQSAVLLMRLVNVLLFVGLFAATFALLRPGQRGSLFWGSLATLFPMGVFLIASVNPSGWAIISAAMLIPALLGYFTAENRGYRFAFVGISLLLALIGATSRGDSASFVAFGAMIAALLNYEKSRRWLKLSVLPAVIMVIGAIFFLSARQNEVQMNENIMPLTMKETIGLAMENIIRLPALWSGNLGTVGLGWLDTSMPPIVWVPLLVLFGGLIFWGLRAVNLRKKLALLAVFAALIILPMYVLWSNQISLPDYVQPRYMLPLLVMLAVVALSGFHHDTLGFNRLQISVIVIIVSGANAIALFTNFKRYITGLDNRAFNLNRGREWWWEFSPIDPMSLWVLGSFAMLVCLSLVATLLTTTRVSGVAAAPVSAPQLGGPHSARVKSFECSAAACGA